MNAKMNLKVDQAKEKLSQELNHLFEMENDKLTVLEAVAKLSADEQMELLRMIEQQMG